MQIIFLDNNPYLSFKMGCELVSNLRQHGKVQIVFTTTPDKTAATIKQLSDICKQLSLPHEHYDFLPMEETPVVSEYNTTIVLTGAFITYYYEDPREEINLHLATLALEAALIKKALNRTNGDCVIAAELLGIPHKRFLDRKQFHGINYP